MILTGNIIKDIGNGMSQIETYTETNLNITVPFAMTQYHSIQKLKNHSQKTCECLVKYYNKDNNNNNSIAIQI